MIVVIVVGGLREVAAAGPDAYTDPRQREEKEEEVGRVGVTALEAVGGAFSGREGKDIQQRKFQ